MSAAGSSPAGKAGMGGVMRALVLFFAAALGPTRVAAAEIKVLSTNALTEVIGEVLPQFERRSGDKVAIEFKPTNILLERIRGGEQADVLILGRQALLELEKLGGVAPGTRADLAQSRVALAIRAGAPPPDIRTAEALKKALLASTGIASSRVGLSGLHLASVLDKLGIAEQVRPKIRFVDGGGRTADLVVRGEADMAVQLASELLPVKGVQLVGPFPQGLDNTVVLTGGVSTTAKQAAAARAFLAFLQEPDMQAVLARNGMERPSAR
jgi:molybdate transport system substrate-binding protein